MSSTSICYNCFRTKPNGGVCPFCGYNHVGQDDQFPLALKPGTLLANRYYLGRVLGQGGFGVTYVALDRNTRSRVALKEFLPAELCMRDLSTGCLQVHSVNSRESYEYGKKQFLDEAKTLAELVGNEHIVRILSYFEENQTAYFAMEYMEGVNLKQYMQQQGRTLEVLETNHILLPVMEALDWVHSKGIIHRDISPDNIMIRGDGTAKLIDFGAARYSTGEVSRSLDVVLKHGFAPKEQYMRHGRQGPFTDVYSMAATYYYALTGKVPPDSIERTEEDELIPPSTLGVNITAQTEDVLLKALSVSAQDRYQTMQEFCTAIIQSSPDHFTSGFETDIQNQSSTSNRQDETAAEKKHITGNTKEEISREEQARKYAYACDLEENAKSLEDYYRALNTFYEVSTWPAADSHIKKCKQIIDELTALEQKGWNKHDKRTNDAAQTKRGYNSENYLWSYAAIILLAVASFLQVMLTLQ